MFTINYLCINKVFKNLKYMYKTVEQRLSAIKMWDESGKEHDHHEMNLVRRLDKSNKIEDFRNNYLPELKRVVKSIEEFNTNSWKITSLNGRVFKYYSTSGKIIESVLGAIQFKVPYKRVVSLFKKKEYTKL